MLMPDSKDKSLINDMMHKRIINGHDVSSVYRIIRDLMKKYDLKHFIADCTEFHLFVKYLLAENKNKIFYRPDIIVPVN